MVTELNEGVKQALAQLDGSRASAVSLVTGLTPGELEELGGLPARLEEEEQL